VGHPAFESPVARIDYPMFVVTTAVGKERAGCLVCPGWFAGRILERVPLGDHVGHLIEPFAGEDPGEGGWFPFSRAKEIEPGHAA
jgi:flavin reductase (DIM6/NTAB) family NADH-FMN oxidoreductase RutF